MNITRFLSIANARKVAYAAVAALAAISFTACSSDDPDVPEDPESPGNEQVDPDATVNGTMTDARMTGFVTDTDGRALSGVTVTTGTHSAVTNEAGAFTISKVDVNDGRSLLTFTKKGYFSVTRAAKFDANAQWKVVLVAKASSSFTATAAFSTDEPVAMKADGMKVDLAKGAMKDRATGQPYTGKVNADMLYLSPNNEHFAEMMPGSDLSGVRADGSRASLVSYGMTAVSLTDEQGNQLQLADGNPATVTFPIPEGMEENPHPTIPLWSFDEATGQWVEEGEARLENGVYVGTVTHFSWVNLDWPEEQAVVNITVKDSKGTVMPFQRVKIGQITATTNASGKLTQEVPAGVSFKVGVKSQWYGNYTPEVWVDVEALTPRQTKDVEIILPSIYKATGRVLENGKPATAYIWMTYNGNETEKTVTDADGTFKLSLPWNYTGAAVVNVLSGTKKTIDVTIEKNDIDLGDITFDTEPGNTDGPMSPTQSKQYLEAVATDFLHLFKPADQQAAIEFANYFVNTFGHLDAPENWGLDENDEGVSPINIMRRLHECVAQRNPLALSRAFDNIYDFSRFAGVYEPGANAWVKTADSKDIIFRFTNAKGQACEVKASGTGSEWSADSNGSTVRVPQDVDVYVKEGSVTHATAKVTSSYNKAGHTANATVSATCANIQTVSSLNATDNKVVATATVKVSGTNAIVATATVDGKNLCDIDKIREILDSEDSELSELFTKATAETNILERLQVKGEVTGFDEISSALDGYYDSYEFSDKEAAKAACENDCRLLNSKIISGVYYNSSARQALLWFQPSLYDEGYGYWEWYVDSALKFTSDNTVYSFEDYFGNSNFVSVENIWDSLISSYKRLWK